jgi:maleylpyruvate isomerase
MLKLYDYFRSSACFRVRIALNLKKLNYECVPIHIVKGEQHDLAYQKINPQQLVPALQDGEKIITQSLAIIEYLEEQYSPIPIFPQDIFQKSIARSYALSIAADIHPLNNLRVLSYLQNEWSLSIEKKDSWYQHWIQKGFSALEKQLSTSPYTGKFCLGDKPSIADIYLVPQMFNARRSSCDLSHYPTLVKIDAACQALPAFQDAFPKQS